LCHKTALSGVFISEAVILTGEKKTMAQAFISFVALIILALFSGTVFGQNAQQKTQELIAALGKTKHKKKEKKGFTTESYASITNEAVVKNNIREYAGVYESSGSDYRLELRISGDGRIEGNGYDSLFDNSQRRNFTLRNARIEAALLTATKVYADGRTQPFEAVFNNQTRAEGKNPSQINSRETKYGLGFIYAYQDSRLDLTSRVFLEFKR
jgi:hypothetical protein